MRTTVGHTLIIVTLVILGFVAFVSFSSTWWRLVFIGCYLLAVLLLHLWEKI